MQDIDSDDDGQSDVFLNSWDYVYRDVVILDENNEVITTYNLTDNNLGDPDNYAELRDLFVDAASVEQTNPWRNAAEPLDVNNDSFISPLDALLVINELNNVGAHELGTPTGEVTLFLDTSDNGFVDPLDALLVLNHLNQSNVDAGEGENALASLPLRSQLDESDVSTGSDGTLNSRSIDSVFEDVDSTRPLDLQFETEEKDVRLSEVKDSSSQHESLDIDPLSSF